MTFSARLNNLMEKNNLTWKELSTNLGIGKNQNIYWQTHNTLPDGKTLCKLATYFNVSTDYLLGLSDSELFDLSEDEKELISLFRCFNSKEKFETIHFCMNLKEKGESYV